MENKRLWTGLLAAAIVVSLAVWSASLAPHAAGSARGAGAPNGLSAPTHFTHPFTPAAVPGVSASGPTPACPLPVAQCWASYNWGGYAVYNSSYVVTKVTGSWVVPSIVGAFGAVCPDPQATWEDASVWVGIDGFVDTTVEQTGTSSDCFYGQVSYYAWYEFYPAVSYPVTISVYPGDLITASVSFVGPNATGVPQFTTTITDVSDHQSYTSPTTAVPGAEMNSAEWIDESAYYNGFLGLTHVSTVFFQGAFATIGGVTKPISGWGTNVNWIVMVDYNWPYDQVTAYAKAVPSALAIGGGGFSVRWLSGGP